ncbi:hypothetical protein DAKH74_045630 [Maudiozyma humilis]|uniref:Flavodoxin-like fold domain-containing protein n=1 Tax=Maudiozyma humilis TaxID=51915 RepID=A0AAV5S2V7_MAUHU|nr:hypothetical protein DAKH74_045630 [Kazachstania humilis]
MQVLIVFAHPDQRSLQASLLKVTIAALEKHGHTVKVSDLYAMNWFPTITESDFPNHEAGTRFQPIRAAAEAYTASAVSADIAAEQAKVMWADMVIFQFPLWWFGLPAIMKGWMDRVLNKNFAFFSGGEGTKGPLQGKKALIITTVGGSEHDFSSEGLLDDISYTLHPIQKGIFRFVGMDALEPVVGYGADSRKPICFEKTSKLIQERIASIDETAQ